MRRFLGSAVLTLFLVTAVIALGGLINSPHCNGPPALNAVALVQTDDQPATSAILAEFNYLNDCCGAIPCPGALSATTDGQGSRRAQNASFSTYLTTPSFDQRRCVINLRRGGTHRIVKTADA